MEGFCSILSRRGSIFVVSEIAGLHPATIPDNGRREGQVQDGRGGGEPEPEVEEEEVEGQF